MEPVKLIECPRDAWQGLPDFIPTEYKAEYLKQLVLAGFKHIDAVSFVSPKHVKQMSDSEDVMAKLNASLPDGAELPEIIGIVVNEKGLSVRWQLRVQQRLDIPIPFRHIFDAPTPT